MSDTLTKPPPLRGRGAASNPAGRFEKIDVEAEYEDVVEEDIPTAIQTEYFRDTSRKVISFNDSPDVGFSASLNPYRGCEHGCIYCYARPTHEFLGLSAGVDFESKLFVKMDAPALLRDELGATSWTPQAIVMSGVTDAYQPVERKLRIARSCLEVLTEFRNPVGIITKNHLVTRDIDLLAELASYGAASVFVSITTLDGKLARAMEPRASRPELRLDAVRRLSEAGVPVGVMVAPIIPGLTDHEVPAILEAAAAAGAKSAGYTVVRLPYGIKDLFAEWLEAHVPLRKEKVLHRIREMRDGKLNDPNFGSRMRGKGEYAELIHMMFYKHRKRIGFEGLPELSAAGFRRPAKKGDQLALL